MVGTGDQIALGTATIHPAQPVVAGSFATVTFTYAAGHPVDDSGYVKIVFRYASDFGKVDSAVDEDVSAFYYKCKAKDEC